MNEEYIRGDTPVFNSKGRSYSNQALRVPQKFSCRGFDVFQLLTPEGLIQSFPGGASHSCCLQRIAAVCDELPLLSLWVAKWPSANVGDHHLWLHRQPHLARVASR
jgi:hypothetical protein